MAELTRRYVVMPMATAAPFDPEDREGVFVLKPWKDPAALLALTTYRENCYPELARDLDAWIRTIAAGPAIRGGVGRRNEPYAATGVGRGRRTPAGRASTSRRRTVRLAPHAKGPHGQRPRRPRGGNAKKRRR